MSLAPENDINQTGTVLFVLKLIKNGINEILDFRSHACAEPSTGRSKGTEKSVGSCSPPTRTATKLPDGDLNDQVRCPSQLHDISHLNGGISM